MLAAAKHDVFPESRAIDLASGCFLMTWPQLARPDGLQRGFVLFAEQRFFVFSVDGRQHRVALAKNSGPSPSDVDTVPRAIVEAFAAYGRYGQGPSTSAASPSGPFIRRPGDPPPSGSTANGGIEDGFLRRTAKPFLRSGRVSRDRARIEPVAPGRAPRPVR